MKDSKIRHSEYWVMQEIFDELYQSSLEGKLFSNLMEIIQSPNNIRLAYRNIKKNTGADTAGVDGLTIKNIEKLTEADFLRKIEERLKRYTPRIVRRTEIPKANGDKRPLGIPSIWDRIIQQSIFQVLEPICEAKFYNRSFGFRPNRSTEHALALLNHRINRSQFQYVVDIDIKGFFDEVNHTKLMRQLWTLGLRDKQLLVILRKMLKAPIRMKDGTTHYPTKGTPQGSVISPLLANVYLNEFDWWLANQWEMREVKEYNQCFRKDGTLYRGNNYKKLRDSTNLKEMYLIRYADDFKIICRKRRDAVKIYHAVKKWLNERLKLPISEEKSCITNLKRGKSEFLGFEISMLKQGKKTNGEDRFIAKSNISKKALKKIKESLSNQIRKIQHVKIAEQKRHEIGLYNSMVTGIHNYYCKATMCCMDLKFIDLSLHRKLYNRLDGLTKYGKYAGHNKIILKYLKSRKVRYYQGMPILPLSYVQHKVCRGRNQKQNKYTPEGRKFLHNNLERIPSWKIKYLIETSFYSNRQTIEYIDNRISRFIAQNGKCSVAGEELMMNELHCHHIHPRKETTDDSYQNLTIVSKRVHLLIHATNEKIITETLNKLKLNQEGMEKLNKLREKAGTSCLQYLENTVQ